LSVQGVLRSVVPRPRRPLSVAAVLPAVLFVLAFAGACVLLEVQDVLLFTSRKAFFLALVLPWVWWMHHAGRSGLRGLRGTMALLTRLCVVALFIMLMAEPRAVRKADVVSVIYTLDRSDSTGDMSMGAGLEYILRTAQERPRKTDEVGLVVFGQSAAVELPPNTSFPFEALNARLATDGTNIEKALSLAAAMLPDEHLGRVVLISDGTQTEGSLSGVLQQLKARDIIVDVLPISYAYEHEVWLEKLDLPRFVRTGETYEAAVVLNSLQDGAGTLRLLENGQTIYEGEVEFSAGKNRYVMPLYLRTPGYYEYTALISVPPGKDGWKQNNRAVGHIYLKGKGKLLVVTDPNGEPRDWETLVRTLKRGEFLVEEQEAYDFPRDALSLMPYDAILFVNAPADAVDAVQMEALRTAVYSQGIGFLMVGGKNSYGPGGFHLTAVEKALPVTMDVSQRKFLPKGALVIILHTCEFAQGNTWGKRVAKEAIRVLGAQDEVGALGYNWEGGESWIFPLTPAAEYAELSKKLEAAQIGDMPTFDPTMQMGFDALKASDAATKHMIIISDGDPSAPRPALLQDFIDAEISVSTVAVFPHDGQTRLMQSIATATGGRFYFPQNPNLLPGIFIKEAKTLKRSMIQNGDFVPTITAPSGILKGIEGFPPLHAYVLTTPKARASVILKGPDKEEVDPVLAVWRYGLGKTAAFTSDLGPNWASDWVPWERYRAFVKQLVSDIARTEREGSLQLRTFAAGSTGMVLIEDFHPKERFLEIEADVSGPHDRSERVKLKQTGPRKYEGRFDLWGKGRYQVLGVGVGGGQDERVFGGFVVPYSPEYLRFRSSRGVLNDIAEKTGGRQLTGEETGEEIFLHDRPPKASSRPIADWFLILLAILIPLDVGVRRIQLDWALIRGWFTLGRKQPAGETFEALLRRKKSIRFLKADEPGKPQAARPAEPEGPKRKFAPPAPEQKGPADERDLSELSTTERLLRMKKKWRDDEDKE